MIAGSTSGIEMPVVLHSSQEIRAVRNEGYSFSNRYLVLVVKSNLLNQVRYAVIASKRVGGAVERNRCKRRIRSRMAKFGVKISMGNDLLIIARSALLTVSPAELDQAFEQLLVKAKLLDKND